MKYRLLIVLTMLLVLACGCNPTASQDGYVVSGKIADHLNDKVFLDQVLPTGNVVVDSATTDAQGNFSLSTQGKIEGIYSVRMASKQSLLVYAAAEAVHLDASAGQFSMTEPSGSKGSKILFEFNKRRSHLRSQFMRNMRDLRSLNREMNPESWSAKEMMADKDSEAYRDYVMGFADTVSLPALADYAVYNLNVEGDFYYIQQYIEKKRAQQVSSEYVNWLETQILEYGDPFIRYEAEDFTMQTFKGDSVSLKSMRGKVVYLFVWASYCGMSRMENARLAAWYDAHPDSQVEILSYSIDVDDRLWKKAIVDDSLHWPAQVMGIMEWTSPEIQQFGVKNIPVSFLLDAKGIIRTTGIHASELTRDYDAIVKRWGAK